MKTFRLPLLLLLACCTMAALPAQTPDSLGRYADFFQRQSAEYQRWLQASGLGSTLRVVTTEVRGDSLVILYLGFYTEDTDSVFALWGRARADFAQTGAGASLERTLFHKMTWYLEVNPQQGQVRLFDTYDLDKTPCFKMRIFARHDSIVVRDGRCRNEERTIHLRAADLPRAGKKMNVTAFKKRYTKQYVYGKLTPYLRQRYERQACDNRRPTFTLHGASEELHFVVTDLCREVLYDETNPWWCEVLKSWACESCKNCIKRERLDVHIYYEETGEGFRLKTDIAAGYGSGWYDKPRDNGYHNLELDYPAYLKTYADKLADELYRFLMQQP